MGNEIRENIPGLIFLNCHVCRDNLLVNMSIEGWRIEVKLSELSKLKKYKTMLTIQTPLWYINLAVALDKAVR